MYFWNRINSVIAYSLATDTAEKRINVGHESQGIIIWLDSEDV